MKSSSIKTSHFVLGLMIALLGICAQQVVCADVITIKQITEDKVESVVTIKGKITNIVPPSSDRAPYSYYVDDGTEMIRVVVWRNVYEQIKDPARFKIGEEIEITGRVKQFRGSVEIHLIGPTGMTLTTAAEKAPETLKAMAPTSPTVAKAPVPQTAAYLPVKIGDINDTFIEKKVMVEGTVAAYRESTYERAPNTITLSDEGKSIPVVFWQEVATKLSPAQKPEVGKRLRIKGRAIKYRDALQIKVYEPDDIHLISK